MTGATPVTTSGQNAKARKHPRTYSAFALQTTANPLLLDTLDQQLRHHASLLAVNGNTCFRAIPIDGRFSFLDHLTILQRLKSCGLIHRFESIDERQCFLCQCPYISPQASNLSA